MLRSLLRSYRAHRYKRRAETLTDTSRLVAGTSEDRLLGLDAVLAQAAGRTVLDVGCHDGTVAEAFAEAGAAQVDGCDISKAAVDIANHRVKREPAAFHVADLSHGPQALASLPLRPKYDIVCYLGMHHHLAGQMRPAALGQLTSAILDRCGEVFVARTPLRHFEGLHEMVIRAGFEPISDLEISGKVGPSRVYRRMV